MLVAADRTDASTAIQTDLPAIFASLELSRTTWLITSLSPGAGEKMSKHSIRAGDVAGLLVRLGQLKEKARGRTGREFPIIAIQEAGLDGFWIHRVLQSEGIESHVVDAASILTSRRRRRAKTDGIDGETLVRTLLAYKRGDPTKIKRRRFGMRRPWQGRGRQEAVTGSTFIRSGIPASAGAATPIPLAAGVALRGTGPFSTSGVFKPSRSSVTHPPGVPGGREPRGNSKRSPPPFRSRWRRAEPCPSLQSAIARSAACGRAPPP